MQLICLPLRAARTDFNLPMLHAPLQRQKITFRNAGLFELLEC